MPLPAMSLIPVHLPPQPTRLIDREDELALLRALLSREEVRLLTLTGPGGVGKTRLAIAAAEQVQERFPDGVWFVDLAPLADPALVVPTIARVVGVREQPGQDPARGAGGVPAVTAVGPAGAGQPGAPAGRRPRPGQPLGGVPGPHDPGHEPRAAAAAAGAGGRGATLAGAWHRARVLDRSPTWRRCPPSQLFVGARPGRGRDFELSPAQCGGRGRAEPAPGRAAAGDRAGRGAHQAAAAGGAAGAAGARGCRC